MPIRFNAKTEVVRINSLVTNGRLFAVDRRAFLVRPFEQQAALIGERAKLQLVEVNGLILKAFAGNIPKGTPNALGLWQSMIGSDIRTSEADRITAVCSGLQSESGNIADLFGGCYRFWVDNLYSCDADGNEDVVSAQSSLATRFTKAQMSMIDELSGMDNLGFNIRGYARGYAEFLSQLRSGNT